MAFGLSVVIGLAVAPLLLLVLGILISELSVFVRVQFLPGHEHAVAHRNLIQYLSQLHVRELDVSAAAGRGPAVNKVVSRSIFPANTPKDKRERALAKLADAAEGRSVEKGQVVITKGDPTTAFFAIVSGEAHSVTPDTADGCTPRHGIKFKAHDVIGPVAEESTQTVVATTPLELIQLPLQLYPGVVLAASGKKPINRAALQRPASGKKEQYTESQLKSHLKAALRTAQLGRMRVTLSWLAFGWLFR